MQQRIIPTNLPAEAADPLLLERLLQPRLTLFWGAHTPTHTLLTALTTFAAQGHSLRTFDGGNRFDGYYVARLARQFRDRTTAIDPYAVLSRIQLSRAFTCFQLAELIENTPPGPDPLFVLDFLATFYDESVPLRDSERLLLTCITHLKRLASYGPVIVGAREPRSLVKERWILLDHLQLAADSAWLMRFPKTSKAALQPRLI